MKPDLIDAYVHKTVERQRPGVSLRFQTSQSLFSSNTIDVGTNLLLRTIAAHAGRSFEHGLDLGCGYGPIGISLAASGLVRQADLIDRDALAVEFARRNIALNGVEGVQAFPSLGLDDVPDRSYDLIATNLPGKAGEDVLRHLVEAAVGRLIEGGQLWGVVVTPLWEWIEEVLGGLEVTSVHVERGSRHVAFGYRTGGAHRAPKKPSGDVYQRSSVEFDVGGKRYELRTSRGVHEFDGLNCATHLLLDQLNELRRQRFASAVAFNVSQGYVPAALKAARMVDELDLTDRDLLALRTTERNLATNNLDDATSSHHQVDWLPGDDGRFSLICGVLRGEEPRAALDCEISEVADRLESGGVAAICGESTPITRMAQSLARRKDIKLVDRQRYRGYSAVRFTKAK